MTHRRSSVFLLNCSYVYAKTSHVQNRGSTVHPVNYKYAHFPKFNINIPIDRPEAHNVNLWPVCVPLKTVLFNTFQPKGVSTRTVPIGTLTSNMPTDLFLNILKPFITPLGFIGIAIICHLTTLKSCMRGLCLCM